MSDMTDVLADHIPAAAIGMFNFPNGGGNSRTCLCGERIEVMFTELSDDESSTDVRLGAKIAAHQSAALSAAGFGPVQESRAVRDDAWKRGYDACREGQQRHSPYREAP